LKKALNDPKCGGNIALSQIPPDFQGLYHLTNQAGDLLGKLFNLELHLQKTYLDKKMQVGSDSQFDYFTKLNLNTDTTIKPSDDSVVYNIKGNAVMKEGSFKPDINLNNLAVDKIKKLTGIDVTKMEASLEQKLALLPDGKFTVKANGDQLELSYSSTAKLGNTNLNGSVGFSNNVSENSKLNDNFSIPFINRVDNVLEFNYLNGEDIIKIINLKINKLRDKYKNQIDVRVGKNVSSDIMSMCNYKVYGARKIDKIIKAKIENQIIDSIIDDKSEIYIDSIMQVSL
jgi:hypothetical protein